MMEADYTHIIEGCRRHDRRAQRALYEAFAPMAMGVCMRYASDRDAAQDLMQDGFVRVFEGIGKVRDASRLGGWIYKVILNECLKSCRNKVSTLPVDEVECVQQPLDPFAADEVVAALQRLSPAQRGVFNLVEVEGYSIGESAVKLKCSEVNVRALLSRAKSRLRELLS